MQKCNSYTLQLSKFSKQVNEEQHRLNSDRILYILSAQTQHDFSDSTKRRWQTDDYLGKWLLRGETKLGKLQKEKWTDTRAAAAEWRTGARKQDPCL